MLNLDSLIIDKENSRFKIYSKFLGFKLGEWQNYQEVNYVALTKVRFAKTVASPKLMGNQSCTSDFTDYKFCVFICKDNRIKHLVFKGDYDKALKLSAQVAEYFQVNIEDYTKD